MKHLYCQMQKGAKQFQPAKRLSSNLTTMTTRQQRQLLLTSTPQYALQSLLSLLLRRLVWRVRWQQRLQVRY